MMLLNAWEFYHLSIFQSEHKNYSLFYVGNKIWFITNS